MNVSYKSEEKFTLILTEKLVALQKSADLLFIFSEKVYSLEYLFLVYLGFDLF